MLENVSKPSKKRTLFWGPLVLAHFPQAPRTGSHFWARVLGGGVPPRPSLWSSLLEPSNLDADQKSSARCSQITYMIICGIQSYSLNCSQKEQGGSSSLHVRMYALVLAPCSNKWSLNPQTVKNCGPLHRDDFNRSCSLLLRLLKSCGHNEWRYFRHTWCRARHGGA